MNGIIHTLIIILFLFEHICQIYFNFKKLIRKHTHPCGYLSTDMNIY